MQRSTWPITEVRVTGIMLISSAMNTFELYGAMKVRIMQGRSAKELITNNPKAETWISIALVFISAVNLLS